MKITRIAAHRVNLPLREGSYKWSGGKAVTVFDSTVVLVETDAGIVDGGARGGLPGRGLPALSVEGRRRSGSGRGAHSRRGRATATGRASDRGCQHRLADARRAARGASSARPGRVHRATVRDLRAMSV